MRNLFMLTLVMSVFSLGSVFASSTNGGGRFSTAIAADSSPQLGHSLTNRTGGENCDERGNLKSQSFANSVVKTNGSNATIEGIE